MTVHTAPRTLIDQLESARFAYELLPHIRTLTAAAEAEALGIDPAQVAKTLAVVTPTGFVLAVIPASERLDMHKVRVALGTDDAQLASEQALAGAYPEFELGAVPAIAAHGERVLLDPRICDHEDVVVDAGSHEQSLRLKTCDLLALTHADVVDLCRA